MRSAIRNAPSGRAEVVNHIFFVNMTGVKLTGVLDSQGIVMLRPVMRSRWTPTARQILIRSGNCSRTDVRGANTAVFKFFFYFSRLRIPRHISARCANVLPEKHSRPMTVLDCE